MHTGVKSQIIGGDADEDHSQIIGGYTVKLLGGIYSPIPRCFGTTGAMTRRFAQPTRYTPST